MIVTRTAQPHRAGAPAPQPRLLDARWPCTPVGHLAFETDTHFATIHYPTL
jgi:hypothetical protein